MGRAADRLRELSGPTYLTRQNYSRITVVGPAALSYPVAAAVPALVQAQALVLAQGPAHAPQVLAQERALVLAQGPADAPQVLAQEQVADERVELQDDLSRLPADALSEGPAAAAELQVSRALLPRLLLPQAKLQQ